MQTVRPLISIILPIFNEELFLEETINSVLQQTYPHFELLISDNASTDNSANICENFAKQDKRIHFYKQTTNIGVTANHYFLQRKTTGKYLIILSGHDKWSANYLEQNVFALEHNPKAVVAYGTPYWINQLNEIIDKHSGHFDSQGLSPITRFYFMFWGKPTPILGLIRHESLPDMEKYNYIGGDMVLLYSLSLKGEFVHSPLSSFYRRQNRPEETQTNRFKRYNSSKMLIGHTTNSFLILLKLSYKIVESVLQSDISIISKVSLIISLFPAFIAKYSSERF